jgi:hypothetical protein
MSSGHEELCVRDGNSGGVGGVLLDGVGMLMNWRWKWLYRRGRLDVWKYVSRMADGRDSSVANAKIQLGNMYDTRPRRLKRVQRKEGKKKKYCQRNQIFIIKKVAKRKEPLIQVGKVRGGFDVGRRIQ